MSSPSKATQPLAAVAASPSVSSSVHPAAVSNDVINWTNQTYWMDGSNGVPSNGGGTAAAAYDPNLGALVVFGDSYSLAATNDTWEYLGNIWYNETFFFGFFGDLPPRLIHPSLTWVPDLGGLVLTGGAYANAGLSNETWLFDGFWTNETLVWGAAPLGYMSSVAYDPAFHGLVSVNGCGDGACTSYLDQTWVLEDFGGWQWVDYTGVFGGPDLGTFGSQMAYDAADGYMLFYGGQFITGASAYVVLNDTWMLNSTGWYNISTTSSGCFFVFCYYPPASVDGSMTWDGQINAVVMFTGYTGLGAENSTWFFQGGVWWPLSLWFNAYLNEPPAVFFGAMPTNSTGIAPVLIGGSGCVPYYGCGNSTWVLEIPPQVTQPIPAYDPVDSGALDPVQSTVQQGTGSGPYLQYELYDNTLGNSAYGNVSSFNTSAASLTFSYNFDYAGYAPGIYLITADVWDFFGVFGTNSSLIQVNASMAASPVVATPAPTEVGQAVSFSQAVTGGSPGYSYQWNFGDGSTSALTSPSHTYAAQGTYLGWVLVTDLGGGTTNTSFSVLVYPVLTASAAALPSPTDVGVSVTFAGTVSGGSGTYSTYSWAFGGGASASTKDATHTFSTPGSYTVYFNVTDSAGFTVSTSTTVVVHPAMVVGSITATSTSPQTGAGVTFGVPVSFGTGPYTYAWSFGDGTSSTLTAPTHSYSKAGTYTVTVVVTDAAGVSQTKTLSVSASTPFLTQLTTPPGLFGLIAVIAVIVAVVGLLLLRRRRKAAPTSAAQPASPPTPGSGGSAPGTQGPPSGPNPPSGTS